MRLALVFAVGCHFAPAQVTGGGDDGGASDSDGAGRDGDATLATCKDKWMAGAIHFGTPVRLATLDTAGSFERDPFFYPDEKTIYYSSDRTGSTGGADIWTATRPALTDSFTTPVQYVPANSLGYDGKLAFDGDGTILVISSSRTGGAGGADDVWIGVRSVGGMFPPLNQTHLMNVNDGNYQEDPVLSDDGLDLYLAPNTGVQHIFESTRSSTSNDFKTPKLLSELDSGQGDADPAIAFGEHLIVFSSLRQAASGTDLFYATRADATKPFAPPVALPEINSVANEGDPWLSADGCRLYFASDTLGQGLTLFQVDVI